jgi:hypothetical protein
MSLKEYMASALTKYKTLKMKGMWEAPSPEQEQIIALTAAVTSLRSKAGRDKKVPKPDKDKGTANAGKDRTNGGDFAWKNVAPKSGESKTKTKGGKTYHWCTHHPSPMWALHNPESFPNLCRLHPKFTELEAAYLQSPPVRKDPTAADMVLQSAMAEIQDSDSDGEDFE